MPVRNQEFYNANESRSYPVDDEASRLSDTGERLPNHIIVDLNLRFPSSLGARAKISGLTVTPNVVALVIVSDTNQPLAAISLPTPIVKYRQYALEAMNDGCGGWVVFGSGIDDQTVNGRYSALHQGGLMYRCAAPYNVLPTVNVGRLNNTEALTGVVTLRGGGDIEVVKGENYEIPVNGDTANTVLRDVIVIRLKQDVAGDRNVFEDYAGPCGKRPESGNCDEPEPVEFINTVGPDCCGNIDIEFRGCAGVSEVTGGGSGVVIDCSRGLAEVCVAKDRLPAADGTLPNVYDNLCFDYIDDVSEIVDPGDPTLGSDAEAGESDTGGPISLPFLERFDDPFYPLGEYFTLLGTSCSPGSGTYESNWEPPYASYPVTYYASPPPTAGSLTVGQGTNCSGSYFRALLLGLLGDGWSALNKQIQVAVHVPSASNNGSFGAIINHPGTNTKHWELYVSTSTQQIQLFEVTQESYGPDYVLLGSANLFGVISTGEYMLEATVRQSTESATGIVIEARVYRLSDAAVMALIGALPPTGAASTQSAGTFGILSYSSAVEFTFVRLNHI